MHATLCPQNIEESIPCTAPGSIVVPSTQEEVVAAIKAVAARPGGNLRAVGRGSSWTPIFFDDVLLQILLCYHACAAF